MSFTGFPVAALDFYDDLEVDNTKSFWEKHKAVYTSGEGADEALCGRAGAGVRRRAKVFRPYRDVRFAKDKTPYKTHQGAFVPRARRPAGTSRSRPAAVRVGAGFYEASGARLAAIRDAMADDKTGPRLATAC